MKIMEIDNWPAWGYIPNFLDIDNPAPLWEQVDKCYVGGWRDFDGFTVEFEDHVFSLHYPGDPPLYELGRIVRDDEVMVIFDYAWVMWQRGDETKIARID